MFKFIVLFQIVFTALDTHAFLDYSAAKAEDLAKTVMYTDAIADLTKEVIPDSELEKSARESRDQALKYNQDAQTLIYVGNDARGVLTGPDFSDQNLEANIRATTSYVQKLKNMSLKIAALGTNGFTALTTLQTNETLEQIRRNQATEIALSKQYTQSKMKKEALEDSKMRSFIIEQRALRKASVGQAR